jgi:hypothetical protein
LEKPAFDSYFLDIFAEHFHPDFKKNQDLKTPNNPFAKPLLTFLSLEDTTGNSIPSDGKQRSDTFRRMSMYPCLMLYF